MAVLGSAFVRVRAITTDVLPDIRSSLNGVSRLGQQAGRDLGAGINQGLADGGLDRFRALQERLEASRVEFRRLSNTARFLGPALTGLAGIVGALGGGLIVLGAAAGNAARSFVVLPAAILAVATAAIATRVALGGVAQALQAGIQAQSGSAASSRAEEAALKRVTAARLALKRLIEEEAPAELEAARERAADAARAAADALLSAERTQRSFNESQKAALDATQALSRAREEATEKLQQLRFETEGAAISERRARLEFEKARDSLQAVQDLPPNSRARQEAELAFAQAELNLRKAIDSNADLKKEEDKATRAGVEGSEEVLSAKEALAQAQQREADLAIDTARAYQRAAEAQRDAAEAAAAAAGGGSVERELNRRIAEARESLREAERAAADAAAGGIDAYAEALRKLSPEARAFVQFLVDSEEAFLEFRAAAGVRLFPLLTSAVKTFLAAGSGIKPLLTETGGVVGEFADNLSTALFTGQGFDRLRSVWGTNNQLLRNLGDAAVNLALAFLEILNAAEPLITAFGEWASSRSATFLQDLRRDGDQLSETFANAQRNFELFASVFSNFFGGLGAIGRAINEPGGAAQTLLEGLEERAIAFNEQMNAMADDGSLNTLFQGLSDNFLLLFDVVVELGRVLLEIGSQQGIGDLLTSIRNAITTFGDIGVALSEGENSPVAALGRFIESFATLISSFAASDENRASLIAFFDTLTFLLDRVREIFESPTVQAFFERWGPLIAQFAAVGLVFRPLLTAFQAFLGTILLLLSPFITIIGAFALFKNFLGGEGGIAASFFRIVGSALRFFGILGLIIGIFTVLYQNSEAFRTSVEAFFVGIQGAFNGVVENLKGVFEEVRPTFEMLFGLIGDIGAAFGDVFSFVMPLLGLIGGGIIGFIGGAIEAITRVIAGLVDVFQGVFFIIGGILNVFIALFTGEWDKAGEYLTKGFTALFRGLGNIIKGLAAPFVGMLNGIIDAYNSIAKRFFVKVPDWVPLIGGREIRLPTIPRVTPFAMGGTVFPQPGGILAQIGEAGRPERIEPLDPDGLSRRDKALIDRLTGGGAGATINVYPSQGMDERELADMVSRKLAYQMRKGSI